MKQFRVVGISHRTAPVAWRERLAVPDARLPDLMGALRTQGDIQEAVVLSTCNRVELYTVTPPALRVEPLIRNTLLGTADPDLDNSFYALEDEAAVRHLFQVAAGLDSLVIGEAEILGQVKRAYDLAKNIQSTGKLTNVLFQRAMHVGKMVRTQTRISEGPTSVASLAVSLAERIFGDLSTSRVFVLGAGPMAELALRTFRSQKVSEILVANRTLEKAELLAKTFGGRALPFERRAEGLVEADIVLCSTGAPDPIWTRDAVVEALRHRRGRSLFFIDIAVPRDVEANVNDLENVYLYNVDDLETLVRESLAKRQEEIEKAGFLVAGKAEEFSPWYRAWLTGTHATLRHNAGPNKGG
jgi:glutamyl-tRNA reductase